MKGEAREQWVGMRKSGKKLARVMDRVLPQVRPGVSLKEIDGTVEREIEAVGGKAAFKGVPGYKWASCINVNSGAVHGIPGRYVVREGDVVTVDVGVELDGWITDCAWTVVAGKGRDGVEEFLRWGKRALYRGVREFRVGARVGEVSGAIEETLARGGLRAFASLTGHGVGKRLHEWPNVPNVIEERVEETPEIKLGMTVALEVIYTAGKDELVKLDDGWTLVAADGKITASFEVTCGAGENGPEVLTPIDTWCKIVREFETTSP